MYINACVMSNLIVNYEAGVGICVAGQYDNSTRTAPKILHAAHVHLARTVIR